MAFNKLNLQFVQKYFLDYQAGTINKTSQMTYPQDLKTIVEAFNSHTDNTFLAENTFPKLLQDKTKYTKEQLLDLPYGSYLVNTEEIANQLAFENLTLPFTINAYNNQAEYQIPEKGDTDDDTFPIPADISRVYKQSEIFTIADNLYNLTREDVIYGLQLPRNLNAKTIDITTSGENKNLIVSGYFEDGTLSFYQSIVKNIDEFISLESWTLTTGSVKNVKTAVLSVITKEEIYHTAISNAPEWNIDLSQEISTSDWKYNSLSEITSSNVEISSDEQYTDETNQKALNLKFKQLISEAVTDHQFTEAQKTIILNWINKLDDNQKVNAQDIFYQLQPNLAKELLSVIIQSLKAKVINLTDNGTIASGHITADKDGQVSDLQSLLDGIWNDISNLDGRINTNTNKTQTNSDRIDEVERKNNIQDILIDNNVRKTQNLTNEGQVDTEPIDDKDIATKKYVDDNAGGGGAQNTSQLPTTNPATEGGADQQQVNQDNRNVITGHTTQINSLGNRLNDVEQQNHDQDILISANVQFREKSVAIYDYLAVQPPANDTAYTFRDFASANYKSGWYVANAPTGSVGTEFLEWLLPNSETSGITAIYNINLKILKHSPQVEEESNFVELKLICDITRDGSRGIHIYQYTHSTGNLDDNVRDKITKIYPIASGGGGDADNGLVFIDGLNQGEAVIKIETSPKGNLSIIAFNGCLFSVDSMNGALIELEGFTQTSKQLRLTTIDLNAGSTDPIVKVQRVVQNSDSNIVNTNTTDFPDLSNQKQINIWLKNNSGGGSYNAYDLTSMSAEQAWNFIGGLEQKKGEFFLWTQPPHITKQVFQYIEQSEIDDSMILISRAQNTEVPFGMPSNVWGADRLKIKKVSDGLGGYTYSYEFTELVPFSIDLAYDENIFNSSTIMGLGGLYKGTPDFDDDKAKIILWDDNVRVSDADITLVDDDKRFIGKNDRYEHPVELNFFQDIPLKVVYPNGIDAPRYVFNFDDNSVRYDVGGELGFTIEGNLAIANQNINENSDLNVESIFAFAGDNNADWDREPFAVHFAVRTPSGNVWSQSGVYRDGGEIGNLFFHYIQGKLGGLPNGNNKLDGEVGKWVIHFKMHHLHDIRSNVRPAYREKPTYKPVNSFYDEHPDYVEPTETEEET